MKLYHGTTGDHLISILKKGLKPTISVGSRNWRSNGKLAKVVCLSKRFDEALVFAWRSRHNSPLFGKIVVIEVDVPKKELLETFEGYRPIERTIFLNEIRALYFPRKVLSVDEVRRYIKKTENNRRLRRWKQKFWKKVNK